MGGLPPARTRGGPDDWGGHGPAYYDALGWGLAEGEAAFNDTVGVLYGLNV